MTESNSITLNGQAHPLAESQSITKLLADLGLPEK